MKNTIDFGSHGMKISISRVMFLLINLGLLMNFNTNALIGSSNTVSISESCYSFNTTINADYGATGELNINYDQGSDVLDFEVTLSHPALTYDNSNDAYLYLVLTNGGSPVSTDSRMYIGRDSGTTVFVESYNGGSCGETFPLTVTSSGGNSTYSFSADLTTVLECLGGASDLFGEFIGIWLFAPDYYGPSEHTVYDDFNLNTEICTDVGNECYSFSTSVNADYGAMGELNINYDQSSDVLDFEVTLSDPALTYDNSSDAYLYLVLTNGGSPLSTDSRMYIGRDSGTTVFVESYNGGSCGETFPLTVTSSGENTTYSFSADLTAVLECLGGASDLFGAFLQVLLVAPDYYDTSEHTVYYESNANTEVCTNTGDQCYGFSTSVNADYGASGELNINFDQGSDVLDFEVTLGDPTLTYDNSNDAYLYLVLTNGGSPVSTDSRMYIGRDSGTTVFVESYNGGSCSETFPLTVTSSGGNRTYSFSADLTTVLECLGGAPDLFGEFIGIWLFAPDYYGPSEHTVYDGFNLNTEICTDIGCYADAGQDQIICEGSSIEICATGGISYIWSTGSNDGCTTVDPIQTTTYTVTITDGSGCTDTDEVTIIVNPHPIISAVNSTDVFCDSNNGTITIFFEDNQIRTHLEFSIDGGISYLNQVADNSGSTIIQNLNPGTYDLWVRWGEEDCPTDIEDAFIDDMQCGSISGNVSEDTNNDDAGEENLENVEIKLLDENGNPAVDGFGNLVLNVFTDVNGDYTFDNLATGMYIVMEMQPADYENVSDEDLSDDDATDAADMTFDDDMIPVELAAGEDDEDNNFIEEILGKIGGSVFKINTLLDDDGNVIEVNEPQEGIIVTLWDADRNEIANMPTEADGTYSFEGYPAGDYIVTSPPAGDGCIDLSDEDVSTGMDDPDGAPDPTDNEIPVTLTPGEEDEGNNFEDQGIGTISGTVTEDIDDNDTGDVPLQNVEIQLLDANNDPAENTFGNPVPPVLTDESGYYEFDNLLPGVYFVVETQPDNYFDVTAEDFSDDDSTDNTDVTKDDNTIPVFLASGEHDENNNFIEELDPCAEYIMGEANTRITVGVVANPDIIGSEFDIVNVTFVVVNLSSEPMTDVVLSPQEMLFSGEPYTTTLAPIFAGDPNNNGQLDPGEIWFYSAVKSYTYTQGDVFIISAGIEGKAPCGSEIGGAADLLFTSGVNMDVEIEQECVEPGAKMDITLTTRLLIDEDAAKNPGTTTIIVGGVPITIQLPASRWEARDLMITATGLNNDVEFDPFSPPAGLELTNFCEQGGVDAGRNTDYILDECEPIETVRVPCTTMGEDDILCEYPDWVFCYCLTIPEDYDQNFFTVSASDDFAVWKADENPAGSGIFGDFIDVTDQIESGGSDEATIEVKTTVIPVELISFDVQKEGITSVLTWKTASEINNSHFIIERSTDGQIFETLGKVDGNGTSVVERNYNFTDDRPYKGLNYYRLAQYDYDGTVSRTDVRIVDFGYVGGSGTVAIYPNPVVDKAIVDVTGFVENITVNIYDVAGRKVFDTDLTAGSVIDLSTLSSGQYMMKMYDADRYEIGSQKIIISTY